MDARPHTYPDPIQAEFYRQRYLADQVETATPERRLLMLFDALLGDLDAAETTFAEGDLEGINDSLCHAQQILFALRDPLDRGSELGRALAGVYSFCLDRLIEANLKKRADLLGEAPAMLRAIAEANRTAISEIVRVEQAMSFEGAA